MTLGDLRVLFSTLISEHVVWINRDKGLGLGWEVMMDEGMDRITQKDPTSDHMRNSNHERGLAQDLVLRLNGVVQTSSAAHEVSGQKWETRHPLCRNGRKWGDGGHYSLEFQGVK